jgi:hypothetical protein
VTAEEIVSELSHLRALAGSLLTSIDSSVGRMMGQSIVGGLPVGRLFTRSELDAAVAAACPLPHCDGDTELIEAHASLKIENSNLKQRVAVLEERLRLTMLKLGQAEDTVSDVTSAVNRAANRRKP